jgi:SpoVK/Ycf46/Vps4 family AAA+-type ATPase
VSIQASDSLKDILRARIIEPRTQSGSPGAPTAYSAVLFGPPGTAKTTTAESVAAALGYGFVVIDTAVFLEDGLANIASRMAYVFDRLERLRDCVILFDEIEEFCLDRTTPGLGMESRILTTAMLTRLNDLRRAERSIFLVATNRLAAFDSAVVRPGRLDMLLFVGTPNLAARAARFEASLPAPDAAIASAVFREFLEETWESDSRFLNYMESERFRAAALASMSAGGLSADRLRAILGDVVRTSILRDESARQEYRDNVALTRL